MMNTDPLVSCAWLAQRLNDPEVTILDATWFMPGTARDAKAEFRAGHIPGAAFFPIDEICDRGVDLPHMLAPPEDFERAVRALGVNSAATIIVYDAQGLFSAPRVWWNLRAMGHDGAFVLDGGLPLWKHQGFPLEAGVPTPAPGDFAARPVPGLVRNLESVRLALEARSAQVVDARPAARFSGHAPEPRAGLRSGHMPGAVNLPFSLVVEDGRLAPAARLEALFEAAGVNLDAPIITTCGSGISASVLALALARLGRLDAGVYDGSWTEWAAADHTEVVQDSQPLS